MKNLPAKLILFFLASVFCLGVATAQTMPQHTPVNLILDTDIGPDYDDVGAMAIMHTLADSGQVNILATMASNQSKYIAGVLDVLNTYFKRPNIPVGVVRGRAVNLTAWQKWDSVLVAKYSHDLKTNAQAEDALTLYRKILAKQPDGSVTIVTVGFLTNMADLLLSKPDEYSPMTGKELIKKKVKQLVCMAGGFPKGREFNVDRDPVSSKIVFDNWVTPIIFSGFEIGQAIHTGMPLVKNNKIQNSPVKEAFAISIPKDKQDMKGRMSWDETAVLVAIKGHARYYNLVEGRFVCSDDGSNSWNAKGKGHFYLTEKMPVLEVEKLLNDLMMR
jgi:inosine-uridine nucleoside N-ribohydrolase